jgi:hypothetical protein
MRLNYYPLTTAYRNTRGFTFTNQEIIEFPVRSAVLKQCTGGLVVKWVTTGEYPLLYVFIVFWLPCGMGNLSPAALCWGWLSRWRWEWGGQDEGREGLALDRGL